MVRGNKVIPNCHFRKDWQRYVRTNFDSPLRKQRRKLLRAQKQRACAPNPVAKLRPLVSCPSFRYNAKQRLGRGFSLSELRAAKIPRKMARSVGISVDPRRRNKSLDALRVNVDRLQQYQSKLILLHERASYKNIEALVGVNDPNAAFKLREVVDTARAPTEEEKKFGAYRELRVARAACRRKRKPRDAALTIKDIVTT